MKKSLPSNGGRDFFDKIKKKPTYKINIHNNPFETKNQPYFSKKKKSAEATIIGPKFVNNSFLKFQKTLFFLKQFAIIVYTLKK